MMERGEIYICAQKGPYSGKPRAMVIVQTNRSMNAFDSVLVCPFTTYYLEDAPDRPRIVPTDLNGLQKDAYLMTDKITAMHRDNCRHKIGRLSRQDMWQLEHALCAAFELPCF